MESHRTHHQAMKKEKKCNDRVKRAGRVEGDAHPGSWSDDDSSCGVWFQVLHLPAMHKKHAVVSVAGEELSVAGSMTGAGEAQVEKRSLPGGARGLRASWLGPHRLLVFAQAAEAGRRQKAASRRRSWVHIFARPHQGRVSAEVQDGVLRVRAVDGAMEESVRVPTDVRARSLRLTKVGGGRICGSVVANELLE